MSPLRLLSRIDHETPACTQTVAQTRRVETWRPLTGPKTAGSGAPARSILRTSPPQACMRKPCTSVCRFLCPAPWLRPEPSVGPTQASHDDVCMCASDLTLPDECAVCIIEASVPMHAPLAPCALVGHLGAVPMIQRSPPLALLRGVVAGLNANSHSRESKPQWGRKREKGRERARARKR